MRRSNPTKDRSLKKRYFFFSVLFALLLLPLNQTTSVNAASNYKEIANYKLKKTWWTQGATITKNYFIYTESQLEKHVGNNPSTILVRCNRNNLKSCVRSKSYKWGHILTLLHKWNTDYFLVRSDYGKNSACWSVSKFQKVNMSNCSWKDNGSPRLRMKTYGGKNGYANQGKYYLRVFGTGNTKNLHLVLYDSSQVKNGQYKILHDIKLPTKMHELEDVMVDDDTGTVYFTSVHAGSNRSLQLNQLKDATISKYIKAHGTTNTDNSGDTNDSNTPSTTPDSSSSEGNSSGYTNVSKNDGIVETTFFGNLQDDGNGCGVYTILNLIVDIMTIGIGILAAIGITIVGIKYLTAKGNEEQTRKAKHRMFEIVIGLVAYALMYAFMQWLLPGGHLNSTSCSTAVIPSLLALIML